MSFEILWILPVQVILNMILDLNTGSTPVVRAKRIALLGLPNSIVRQIHVLSILSATSLPNYWMDLDVRLQHTMQNMRTRELSS